MGFGENLVALSKGGHPGRLYPDKLSRSPGHALLRIKERFGEYPDIDGSNVEGIVALRDVIHDAAEQHAIPDHSFIITAPHTHWDDSSFIVITHNKGRYRSGPCLIDADTLFTPVSFVFSEGKPLAYEWVDESIKFIDSDLRCAYDSINAINELVWRYEWPLGISLNFRFKELRDDVLASSIEYTFDECRDDRADILRYDEFMKIGTHEDYAQVGWHAYSDRRYDLDENGLDFLQKARMSIKKLSLEQQKALSQVLNGYFQ